jgi:FMN-dependent NADH-azoreductase
MLTPLFTDGVWNTSFKTDLKDYCDFVKNNDKGRIISNNGGYQSTDLKFKRTIVTTFNTTHTNANIKI